MADTEQPQLEAKAEPAKQRKMPRRRSRAFARGLLAKLLKLPVSSWEATDALDVYADMESVVELDVDAFLQPLAPLGEGGKHE